MFLVKKMQVNIFCLIRPINKIAFKFAYFYPFIRNGFRSWDSHTKNVVKDIYPLGSNYGLCNILCLMVQSDI